MKKTSGKMVRCKQGVEDEAKKTICSSHTGMSDRKMAEEDGQTEPWWR